MLFSEVHHVAIICSDYEKSKQFYTELLGFKIVQEIYRAERQSHKLDLDAGSMQLELFSFPNPPQRVSNPEAAGLRHLAFSVTDFDGVIKNLEENGIVVEPVRADEFSMPPGKKYTFFADPDGLPIEIKEQ